MKEVKKNLIYSQYEIDTIVFYGIMIAFLPVILIFTYIFDIDQYVDINLLILVISLVNIVFLIVGTLLLYINKNNLKRKVKPSYQTEFFFLVITTIFGLLGFVVFYDYLGGNRDYIANILVVLFCVLTYVLIHLGRKFFKFDYMKKK